MTGKTILVVEDQDLMRHAVHDALAGAFPTDRVIAAANGLEAVALSGKFQPALIVMDPQLPYMDGVEATRRIKGLLPDTKVIFLSLSDHPSDQRAAVEAGADGYAKNGDGFAGLIKMANVLL